MALLVAHFSVRDVDEFRRFHAANDTLRRDHGCLGARVAQDVQDPAIIVVLLDFSTVAQAQAYLDAALARGAVESSTMDGVPRIEIYGDAVTKN
jgi:quinol monooxygenase YgiN